MLNNKSILITGGTGSLGKIIVRRLLSGELGTPGKVIVFSRDEAKQHDMRISYQHRTVTTDEVIFNNFKNVLEFRIGDIRDYHDVCSVLNDVDYVINAAALKQVPTCEYFPEQAVLTNCMGAVNLVRAIREHDYKVDTVVGISTDKACKPVNVMGMTKSIHERVLTSANVTIENTRFICVRYGNVLASRGSVIPLFHEQIRNGGPVTITVPEMTRFLLSLDQAVDTVFAALKGAKAGETYIPNAPSASILNIAKSLIGTKDIEIEITGIRPGEKMHEIMISEEEYHHTVKRGEYYAIKSMLPELREMDEAEHVLSKEFSSENNIMSMDETRKLLEDHKLLTENSNVLMEDELLA